MSSMKKIISILFLLILFVFFYLIAGLVDSGKIIKFSGSVVSVGDNSILILGAFEDELKKGKPQYEYGIEVDQDTKITKNSFVLPKNGEMFVVEDLPKKTQEVDFETLKKDSQNISIGVETILIKNFLGRVQSKALEVVYIGPEY